MEKSIKQVFTILFLFCIFSVQAQEKDTILTNYIQNVQYQQAIEYIDTQETTKDLEYQKALCYKWLNNYSKAIEILKIVHESYPDDVPVQLELAQCYEANLQYSQSIDCYERLTKADSSNTYFQVRKADLFYRAEKYTTALEDYLQIDPETYNPVYLKKSIALCYEKLNLPDSAKVYYQTALEMDASDAFSALSLVKLYIQQKEYQDALSYSEKFLAADTTNAQMNVLNAITYYNLNEYEKAVPRFEKCHAAGDSSLQVIRSLGISYFFLQNDSAAYPYLCQAYGRDTTNMPVLYALAKVSYNLEQYSAAIPAYKKLIENELPNRNALFTYYTGLAQACEKDSLYQDAKNSYITAKQFASSNEQSMTLYFNLAVLLETELKDYSSAVYYYTQYQATLLNYQDSLLGKPNPDPEETKAIEIKLKALAEHISQLKTEYKIDYTDKIWNK
ncbi:MAG: tetratricopeptide repeat protein [Candidatus Azobacteroides sp.]|nr:tetratricopeptide repeat protein [Candidatus Azobacteroides sp.]